MIMGIVHEKGNPTFTHYLSVELYQRDKLLDHLTDKHNEAVLIDVMKYNGAYLKAIVKYVIDSYESDDTYSFERRMKYLIKYIDRQGFSVHIGDLKDGQLHYIKAVQRMVENMHFALEILLRINNLTIEDIKEEN